MNRLGASSPCWTCRAALLVAVLSPATASADAPQVAPEPTGFRRVLVPAERIGDVTRDGQTRIPMLAAEFQRLVEIAASPPGSPQSRRGRLTAAEHVVNWSPDTGLEGSSELEIEATSDQPSLVELAAWNQAVRRAQWLENPPRPATLARDAAGRYGILASGSGKLQLEWSVPDATQRRYPLELPVCPRARLRVAVPAGYAARVNEQVSGVWQESAAGAEPGTYDLSGRSGVVIEIAPTNETRPGSAMPAPSYQLQTTYEISPRGLEVAARFELFGAVAAAPLRVAFEAPLRPIDIHLDGAIVAWRPRSDANGPGIEVLVPQGSRGASQLIVHATAPLVTSAAWQLPRLDIPESGWEEGTVRLRVAAPLALARVAASGSRQTSAGPLAEPLRGTHLELQCYRRDAALEIEVAPEVSALRIATGTTVRIEPTQIAARQTTRLTSINPLSGIIDAKLAPGWSLADVTSQPSSALADWQIAVGPDGQSLLRLAFDPATSDQVELSFDAVRPRTAPSDSLPAAQLRIVEFDVEPSGQRLVAVSAGAADLAWIEGPSDLVRLDPETLDSPDRRLILQAAGEELIVDDPRGAPWELIYAARPPRFDAQIHVAVEFAAPDLVREQFEFRCLPESAAIDALTIRFSAPRPGPLEWRSPDDALGRIRAQPLEPDPDGTEDAAEAGQRWRIEWQRPVAGPVTLQANGEVRPQAAGGGSVFDPCLAAVEGAAAQTGQLAVSASGAIALGIENRGLTAIHRGAVPQPQPQTLRGRYRFDPAQDVQLFSQPLLRIELPQRRLVESSAFVWQARLEAAFSQLGRVDTMANYWVENSGAPDVAFELPSGSRLVGAWVDGQPAAADQAGPLRFRIALPASRRLVSVAFEYERSQAPLGLLAPGVQLWPACELEVLSESRTLWVPPDYKLFGLAGGDLLGPSGGNDRWQRWLGAMRRPSDDSPESPPARSAPQRSTDINQVAAQVLVQLGQAARDARASSDPSMATWAAALVPAARGLESQNLGLLIDVAALAQRGIDATDPVALGPAASDQARGRNLLARAGLVLLVLPGGGVLSTLDAVARRQEEFAPLDDAVAYEVRNGSLRARFDDALAAQGGRGTVDVLGWTLCPPLPWTAPAATLTNSDLVGWRAYAISSRAQRVGFYLVHVHALRIWSLALALVSAAVAGLLFARSLPWAVVLIGVLAASAIVAPDALAPAPLAALLGSGAGGAWRLWTRWRSARRDAAAQAAESLASQSWVLSGGLALLIAVLGGSGASGGGAPPDERPPADAAAAAWYDVLVPIDQQRQPSGDWLLVPEVLAQKLRHAAAEKLGLPRDWLWTDALYELVTARHPQTRAVHVKRFLATFDLQTIGAGRRVPLPISGAALRSSGLQWTLDGRRVEPRGDGHDQAPWIVVDEPGEHSLAVTLVPETEAVAAWQQFALSVPPLATARLLVARSDDEPFVEVLDARGDWASLDEQSRLLNLGPVDTLRVRWVPLAGAAPSAAPSDELWWLDVQPGSVVLTTHWLAAGLPQPRGVLWVQADARLKLLSTGPTDHPAPTPELLPDGTQLVALSAESHPDQPDRWTARWLLTGRSGVGQLRLPQLKVIGHPQPRRWLAASVAPQLEAVVSPSADVQPVPPDELLVRWGLSAEKPPLAYRLPAETRNWVLATRPSESVARVDQRLALVCRRRAVECEFIARLEGLNSLQCEIGVPEGFVPLAVESSEDEARRALRWVRAAPDVLRIFLSGPLRPRVELIVRGSIPLGRGGEAPLPQWTVAAARLGTVEVEVFRETAVDVELVDVAAAPSNPPGGDAPRDLKQLRRLVAAYRQAGQPLAGRLRVLLNEPQVAAQQTLRIQRAGTAWQARLDIEVQARRGRLDVLDLDVPPEWSGPFTLEPPLPHEVHAGPQQGGRLRVLVPGDQSGPVRVRVTGPLAAAAGQRVAAPHVRLVGTTDQERFVLLPVTLGVQQVAWETRGLTPVELGPAGNDEHREEGGVIAYRVESDDFVARLQSVAQATAQPQVRLADVATVCHGDGSYSGAAAFDVEPGGAASCQLLVPPQCTIQAATVAGLPAVATAGPGGRWRIVLGSNQLPQRIEVAFRGQLPQARHGRFVLTAPSLDHWPVERTVWTVYGPPQVELGQARDATLVNTLRANLYRLAHSATILSLAPQAAAEEAPEEVARWYRPWARRMLAARRDVRREILTSRDAELAVQARSLVLATDEDQQQIARQVQAADALTQLSRQPYEPGEVAEIWRAVIDPQRPGRVYTFNGGRGELVVAEVGRWLRGPLLRWAAALAIAVASLVLALLARRGRLSAALPWIAAAAGIALGLVWYAALAWPGMGLLVAAVSLVYAAVQARRARPRRRPGDPAMTITLSHPV